MLKLNLTIKQQLFLYIALGSKSGTLNEMLTLGDIHRKVAPSKEVADAFIGYSSNGSVIFKSKPNEEMFDKQIEFANSEARALIAFIEGYNQFTVESVKWVNDLILELKSQLFNTNG